MISPTSRAILLAALGAPIALVLVALMPSAWPVGPAWALAVAALILVDAQMASDPASLRVATKAPTLTGIGAGAFEVLIRLGFAPERAPQSAEVAIETNPLIELTPRLREPDVVDALAETGFRATPTRRGEARLTRAFVRWRGPLGLAWRQSEAELDHRIAVAADIGSIERYAQRLFSRTFVHGLKPMRDRGDGSEFDALAKFEQGMDRRMVDWKQSARHMVLLAKEVRAERNHQLVFAIDTGRLMCQPVDGTPRVDAALNAALMLAYVGLKLGDRVSFFGFDARPHLATGFVSGPGAFAELQTLTSAIDYSTEETNFTLSLSTLAERLKRRSMVVVFTDFADTVSAELMVENVTRLTRRHMVVFVTFRDEELESMQGVFPRTAGDVSRAVIAGQLLNERDVVLARLRRLGVHIVSTTRAQLGPELVRAYDELRRQERV
ncbi:MAG: DUF58 domain-containing protein [Alphaproteobacteria bacterium]|nr:DUF58 domain-containing protein [Alphaproteobacteria bacterium]